MAFNKRHYEMIATVCQEYNDHASNLATKAQRLAWQEELERRLADMFAADNPRFDRGRFLHACMPGSNVKARTAHLKVA